MTCHKNLSICFPDAYGLGTCYPVRFFHRDLDLSFGEGHFYQCVWLNVTNDTFSSGVFAHPSRRREITRTWNRVVNFLEFCVDGWKKKVKTTTTKQKSNVRIETLWPIKRFPGFMCIWRIRRLHYELLRIKWIHPYLRWLLDRKFLRKTWYTCLDTFTGLSYM